MHGLAQAALNRAFRCRRILFSIVGGRCNVTVLCESEDPEWSALERQAVDDERQPAAHYSTT